MFSFSSRAFLKTKSCRHGCTTQKTELGMHQNAYSSQNELKNRKTPDFNMSSMPYI